MAWGAVAAAVIGGMMSGGSGSTAPGVGQNVQAPNQAQAMQDLYNNNLSYLPTAQQFYGMNPSYANQAFQLMYGNPYAGGMQTAADQAGTTAGQLAPQAYQAAQGSMAAGQQALGAGQQVWQTAQDPQNQLHDYMQGQALNNANVINSQYGLGSSGAGAGVANQALNQFNMDWQNQQLSRQAQGAQALNSGISSYTGANNSGLGMGQVGINLQQQSGTLPYQTMQTIGQSRMNAIDQNQLAMQGAMQPYQQNTNNLNSYLGLGQAAQAQANNQAYQQQLLAQQGASNIANLAYQGISGYTGQQAQNAQNNNYLSSGMSQSQYNQLPQDAQQAYSNSYYGTGR